MSASFATGPPDERCFQASAKCRPAKITGWQVTRKRSSVVRTGDLREAAHRNNTTYSITSSARASKVGGTSTPSERAVCRLMVNSNLVDCRTGSSLGLVPLRMLPA